jgi:hypothetical protein
VVPRGPSDEKEVAFSLFSRGTRLRDRGRVCRAGADRNAGARSATFNRPISRSR